MISVSSNGNLTRGCRRPSAFGAKQLFDIAIHVIKQCSVRCYLPDLYKAGEPSAIQQGETESDGILNVEIYELPDRQFPLTVIFI